MISPLISPNIANSPAAPWAGTGPGLNTSRFLNSEQIKEDFLESLHKEISPDQPEPPAFIKSLPNELKHFIGRTLIAWTTGSSAFINILSAPVRLFDEGNPLKKIINHVSMFFTKLHLGAYSIAGLLSAIEQRNPLLVFSFLTEGVAAFLSLRSIYLFRGIATGIDGAVAGIKDKHKRSHFRTFQEGWLHSWNTIKKTFMDFSSTFAKDPLHLFNLGGHDIAIFASLMASAGGVLGMTLNEKLGGAIRDFAGAVGDYGIFKLDNPTAKSAGFFYMGGSILDLAARVFNKGIASILGVNNTTAFEKLRDAFHECAIAFDRLGQFFFLRYNQQDENNLQSQTIASSKPLPEAAFA